MRIKFSLLLALFVACGNMTPSGDITAVNTPTSGGLTGGVTAGAASLSIAACVTAGDVRAWDGAAWTCTTPGTVTSGTLTTNQTVKATGASSIGDAWPIDDGTAWGVPGAFQISELDGATVGTMLTLTGPSASSAPNISPTVLDVSSASTIALGTSAGVSFGISSNVSTTRTGTGNLTNIAGYFSATGGQFNYAIYATDGDVLLNFQSGDTYIDGNTTIGDSSGDAHALNGTLNANGTSGADGNVLTIDAATHLPKWATPGSGGTVTSITAGTGLAASPGSPITTSGTLNVSLNSGVTQTCSAGTAVTSVTPAGITSCTAFGSSSLTNSAGNNVVPKSNGTNLVAGSAIDDGTTFASTDRGQFGSTGSVPQILGSQPLNLLAIGVGSGVVHLRNAVDAAAASVSMLKSRSTDPTVRAAVANADALGTVGYVGATSSAASDDTVGAQIQAVVTGAVSAKVMPTELQFYTNGGASQFSTKRMTIGSAGDVSMLFNASVTGALTADAGLRVFDTAGSGLTSTTNTVSLNITPTSCGAGNHVSAISALGVGTCTADSGGGITGSGTSGNGTRWTGTSSLGLASFADTGTEATFQALSGTIQTQSFGAGSFTLTIGATTTIERLSCNAGFDTTLTVAAPGTTTPRMIDLVVVAGGCNFIGVIGSSTLYSGDAMRIVYDTTSSSWRAVALRNVAAAGTPVTGSLTSGKIPVANGTNSLTDGSWTDTGSALSTASTISTGAGLTTIGAGGLTSINGANVIGEEQGNICSASNGAGTLTDASFARNCRVVLWSLSGAGVLDGFGYSSGTPTSGDQITFCIYGGGSMTFSNENASETTAGRRFSLPTSQSVITRSLACHEFVYDGTATRWRSADGGATVTLSSNVIGKGNGGNEVVGTGLSDNATTISTSAENMTIVHTGTQTSALSGSYTGTAQTVTHNALAAANSGTYNTTSGALTAYGLNSSVTSTRSAGANNLVNVAGTFAASGGQVNTALETTTGDVNLGTSSGNITIGASSGQTLTVNAAASFASTLSVGTTFTVNPTSSPPLITIGNGANAVHVLYKDGSSRPTVTNCGTSPTVIGTDAAGFFTTTATPLNTCTLTFNAAYGANQDCELWAKNGAAAVVINYTEGTTTVSNIQTSAGAALASGVKVHWLCADH